jgi:hypothetical protein
MRSKPDSSGHGVPQTLVFGATGVRIVGRVKLICCFAKYWFCYALIYVHSANFGDEKGEEGKKKMENRKRAVEYRYLPSFCAQMGLHDNSHQRTAEKRDSHRV